MIRAIELALFAAPVLAFVLWLRFRDWVPAPRRSALLTALVVLVALGVALAWTGLSERHREGTRYVPATFENGRIIPGHGT